ncbi:MAG: hypothetical protein DMG68_11835 [Acidobacteria bacterium]|nr:MAG: hypothetical protein DMG68_11835 [Acidobacteriota bacterium]
MNAAASNPKRVNIRHNPGGKPAVDQETIEIWSTKGEEIEWACDHPGQEFYICFEGKSPFQQQHYHSKNNRSGPIQSGASGSYKYSVEVDGHVLDPTVIIKP